MMDDDSIFFDDSDDPGWVEFRRKNRESGAFVSGPWEPDPAFEKTAPDEPDVAKLINGKIDRLARQSALAPLPTPSAVGWPEFWRQLEQRIDDAHLTGLVRPSGPGIADWAGVTSEHVRRTKSDYNRGK